MEPEQAELDIVGTGAELQATKNDREFSRHLADEGKDLPPPSGLLSTNASASVLLKVSCFLLWLGKGTMFNCDLIEARLGAGRGNAKAWRVSFPTPPDDVKIAKRV